MKNGNITAGVCIIKGMISGSLFGASIISGYGIAPQILLFVIGLLVFVESVCAPGRDTHIGTVIFFNVIGICVSFLLWSVLNFYIIAIFVAMGAVYIQEFLK